MQTLRNWRAKKEAELRNPKYWLSVSQGGKITWLKSNIPSSNLHNVGWKLHVSLDSRNPKNLKFAWDIASTLCKGYGISRAKVFNTSSEFKEENKGREITIYLDVPTLNEESISKFCLNLEISLAARKIIPAPRQRKAQADRRVDGSRYLSFRNDARRLTEKDSVEIPKLRKRAEEMDAAGISINEIQKYVKAAGYTLDELHPEHEYYVSQQEACSMANPAQGIYSWNPYCFPDKFGLEDLNVSEAYPNSESKAEKQMSRAPEEQTRQNPAQCEVQQSESATVDNVMNKRLLTN